MDGTTIRTRALAIEMEAQRFMPAEAIARLAGQCARLESALTDARAQLAELRAPAGGYSHVLVEIDGQVG